MEKLLPNRLLLAMSLVLILSSALVGQTTKLNVLVSQSGDDAVGMTLAYSLREELSRSARYQVSAPNDANLQIIIVSVDSASGSELRGSRSAIAITYTMKNYLPYEKGNPQTWYHIYLTTTVFSLGKNRTVDIAKDIVAELDAEVEKYRADSRKYLDIVINK